MQEQDLNQRLSHNEQRLARSEEMIKNIAMDVAELSKAVSEQGRQTHSAIQKLSEQTSSSIQQLSNNLADKNKINWQAVGAIFLIIAAIGSALFNPIYVEQQHMQTQISELNELKKEVQNIQIEIIKHEKTH